MHTGLHDFKEFVVDYNEAPVSSNMLQQHSKTNIYTTTTVSLPPGHLPVHYMGVHDYGLDSAPTLAYTGTEKGHSNFTSDFSLERQKLVPKVWTAL
jgi:hypothetical protein